MTVSLGQAKEQLRITSSDQDGMIADRIASAVAVVQKYTGDLYDPVSESQDLAQLLLIEYWFYPDDKVPIDPVSGLPVFVAALLWAFRTPTAA